MDHIYPFLLNNLDLSYLELQTIPVSIQNLQTVSSSLESASLQVQTRFPIYISTSGHRITFLNHVLVRIRRKVNYFA